MSRLTEAQLLRNLRFHRTVGRGTILEGRQGLILLNPPASAERYHNAQLDDYDRLPRRRFRWRPPVALRLEAAFSHPAAQLQGTAGFGFWNDPFMMTGWRVPTLPQALWFFFASPPSNMALAKGVPGRGWKAAVIDARRAALLALLPAAPLGMLLMRVPTLYTQLWPIAQRALGVHEALIGEDMTAWHHYEIEWRAKSITLRVDGRTHLQSDSAPSGPLGLVIWLDNQAMIVTPQGHIRHMLVGRPEAQWLQIRNLVVERV